MVTCGSWLACDESNLVYPLERVVGIAGKPAPTFDCVEFRVLPLPRQTALIPENAAARPANEDTARWRTTRGPRAQTDAQTAPVPHRPGSNARPAKTPDPPTKPPVHAKTPRPRPDNVPSVAPGSARHTCIDSSDV